MKGLEVEQLLMCGHTCPTMPRGTDIAMLTAMLDDEVQPACPDCRVTMRPTADGDRCPECGRLEPYIDVTPPQFDGPRFPGA